MKIGFTGIDLPEGKIKYTDDKMLQLENKFEPQKVSPFFAEFVKDGFVGADAVVVPKDKLLDIVITDIEKLETRLNRTGTETEKEAIKKCISYLEKETPLCDAEFSVEETKIIRELAPVSYTPTVVLEKDTAVNDIIKLSLEKSKTVFFYTAGKQEVHAWPVKKDSNIVDCAGKIHTDFARGFIKADIISFEDMMNSHNMNDARTKGLVKVVGRDYIIKNSDIIEIRFNV